jgi:hypothetical protein
VGEGAGVGGDAGADGRMLSGTPLLLEVDSLFAREWGRLCLERTLRKDSMGAG